MESCEMQLTYTDTIFRSPFKFIVLIYEQGLSDTCKMQGLWPKLDSYTLINFWHRSILYYILVTGFI